MAARSLLSFGRVAGGQNDVVDLDARSVGERQRTPVRRQGTTSTAATAVMHDLTFSGASASRDVKRPLEVFAHHLAGQEVIRADWAPASARTAAVAFPAVVALDQPGHHAALAGAGMRRLELRRDRVPAARRVQDEVVRLSGVERATTRCARVDDVHGDRARQSGPRGSIAISRSTNARPHGPSPTTAISVTPEPHSPPSISGPPEEHLTEVGIFLTPKGASRRDRNTGQWVQVGGRWTAWSRSNKRG